MEWSCARNRGLHGCTEEEDNLQVYLIKEQNDMFYRTPRHEINNGNLIVGFNLYCVVQIQLSITGLTATSYFNNMYCRIFFSYA